MPTKKKAAAKARMTLSQTMTALEKAGSAQTRKTWARHGVEEPMYGVSFAALKTLRKRIDVDHELALELWETGNFDARNLAVKIVDPALMSPRDLDRWAKEPSGNCTSYVAYLAAEGPHAAEQGRCVAGREGRGPDAPPGGRSSARWRCATRRPLMRGSPSVSPRSRSRSRQRRMRSAMRCYTPSSRSAVAAPRCARP